MISFCSGVPSTSSREPFSPSGPPRTASESRLSPSSRRRVGSICSASFSIWPKRWSRIHGTAVNCTRWVSSCRQTHSRKSVGFAPISRSTCTMLGATSSSRPAGSWNGSNWPSTLPPRKPSTAPTSAPVMREPTALLTPVGRALLLGHLRDDGARAGRRSSRCSRGSSPAGPRRTAGPSGRRPSARCTRGPAPSTSPRPRGAPRPPRRPPRGRPRVRAPPGGSRPRSRAPSRSSPPPSWVRTYRAVATAECGGDRVEGLLGGQLPRFGHPVGHQRRTPPWCRRGR